MTPTAEGQLTQAGPVAAPAEGGDGWRTPSLVGLLAFLVAFAGSWIPSVWVDEVATIDMVGRPWPDMFDILRHVDAVHGAYYVLLHAWSEAFGLSPVSLRIPSAIAVGLVAAGTVVLGRTLAGARAGLVAGLVVLILPATTWAGEEARSSAFVMAASVWAAVALVGALRGRSRRWWAYGALVALTGVLFLQAFLVVLAHAVSLLWSRAGAQTWRRFGLAAGAAAVVVAPVAAFGLSQRGQVAWIQRPGADVVEAVLVRQWFGGSRVLGLAVWLAVGAIVLVPRLVPAVRSATPLSLLHLAVPWLLLPTALVVAVSVVSTPQYTPRYLRYGVVPVALLLGTGIAALRRTWMQVVAFCVIGLLSLPPYVAERGEHAKEGYDWSSAADAVSSHGADGDGVVFVPDDGAYQSPRRASEAYPAAFRGLADVGHDRSGRVGQVWADGVPEAAADAAMADLGTVWVLVEHKALAGESDAWLARHRAAGWTATLVYDGPRTDVYRLTSSS
ncbi:glycosyltransferase family 39 protein [Cellulomonas sp. URHD0024]|uniref:glycosyltransferase family 39 protein n=1 Tax=Cellulomonas sp. URHD0024 TaxID=1302620 RepID=UPI0004103A50|nr:glycosyltransferase family 39 protein [Cellulomonas sp. URHD0024]